MPFEIKNPDDNSVLHSYPLSVSNFDSESLQTDIIDVKLPCGNSRSHIWFFDGIRMSYSESVFNSEATFDWKGDMRMVTMYFNLKGKFSVTDNCYNKQFELGTNQHNLFYGREAEGKMKVEELLMKSFMIQFTEEAFLRITKDGNETLKRFAENILAGNSSALCHSSLNIDLNIHSCINAVINCKFSGQLKKMYLLSKSIELLVLQAESYDQFLIPKAIHAKTDYDKERLIYARDYLIQHMEMPPNLSQLARTTGINEYKLKRGFKELFGNTVFGYLSEIRLDLAKADLQEKKKTVTEIAFSLGYSSVPHFSTAFKKKFGVSPTMLAK